MKGIEGVIYDCDGVLFESHRANLAYYNSVLEQFGEPAVTEADRDRAHLCHTAASPRVFEELLGPERVEEALEKAARVDFRRFIPHMTPEPGMASSLATLASRMPLAVATNRGVSMPELLEHFELAAYFSAVVTSRDVPRPKPYPDMLHEAARRIGLRHEHLIFVGDSELDSQAARAAGIRFAAYRNDLDCDIRLESHRELVELLG